jgi:two-component system, sporulation sensor kinase E
VVEKILTVKEKGNQQDLLIDKLALLEAAINSIEDSVKIIDRNFKIIFMNDAAKKYIKEYCFEEYDNKNGTVCMPCPAKEVFASKRHSFLKMEMKKTDGKKCIVELNTYPIFDKDRNVIAVIEIAKDVTDMKNIEDNFLKAAKLACAGEIAAIMAHEIRNPLNTILNIIKLLLSANAKRTQEEINELYNVMMEESLRLNKILENFLQFSKPPEPAFKVVNVNELIKDVMYLFRFDKYCKSKIAFDVKLQENISPIMADASMLKQLIWNVVINGIEAMNEKGGVLSIKTGQRGNKIFIKISDTGVGMSTGRSKLSFLHLFLPINHLARV